MQVRMMQALQTPPTLEAERDEHRDVACVGADADTGSNVASTLVTILAGRIFDSEARAFRTEQAVVVDPRAGIIVEVRPIEQDDVLKLESGAKTIGGEVVDLRKQTVLPGFVDAHVHFFLHPYSEVSWEDQLTKEPLAERTIRAVNHARATLLAGFTTVRDLGTEGAGDADIALRRCLSGTEPLAPGPRYFTANRALVPTGAYGPKGNLHLNEEGVEGITGAEVADGVEGCRRAVRRQVGAGADWIKIYADYRVRSRLSDVASAASASPLATFQNDEFKALIDTAHFYGLRVAAHAATAPAMRAVAELGVDSIEHGHSCEDPTVYALMRERGVAFVPTLGAYYTLGRGGRSGSGGTWDRMQRAFKVARESGVSIAVGGDTGVFSHGDNALEMRLMVQLGAQPTDVLASATIGGWECVRPLGWEEAATRIKDSLKLRDEENKVGRTEVGDNAVPFGVLRAGFAADIIATVGDLEGDFDKAVQPKSISFVMKMGRIYKRDGIPML